MPWALAGPPGSPEAVKVAAAAAASGTQVKFTAADRLLYTDSESGVELYAANAAARLLGEVSPEPSRGLGLASWALTFWACLGGAGLQPAGCDAWLDWEEGVLRPALRSSDEPRTQQACRHLAASLASPEHVLLEGFSLADIVLAATLQPHAQVRAAARGCCGHCSDCSRAPSERPA